MESFNVTAVTDEEELAAVNHELSQVVAKIGALQDRKQFLVQKRQSIKDRMLLKRSKVLSSKDWSRSDFPWSDQIKCCLKNVFRIQQFRPYQEVAINAILSKEDTILIMPTGGGKSLCYQLPGVIFEGFVLVVCPLVALMEDQMMYLRKIDFSAHALSQNSPKDEVNMVMKAMTDKMSPMKLLYVTPERMAKSKRFMNKLQSAHSMGRLSCIAIDEVHCCSQWGHDFRPDYKYLGVLKGMFNNVPLFGLTATATSKIVVDTQKILNIEGCLVIKSSFNRPNLYYEVRAKPSNRKEYINELEDLLKHKYAGKSGIIYTTTIKDAEETVTELRNRSLSVVFYHANMDHSLRHKAHQGWVSGKYKAIVATIAFGMGIDKPDVRFVIHQTLSKSMENYYQESGRAGRDGEPADCIVFYRLADVFKTSCMGFSEHNALENLYSMVDYCLSSNSCRRSLIASHFDEGWEINDCKRMCDLCRNPREVNQIDITNHCITIFKIIDHASTKDTKLTIIKLLDSWYNKGPVPLRLPGKNTLSIPVLKAENIIAFLLINSYLKEDFQYTAYSCLSYLQKGPRSLELNDPKCRIMMDIKGAKISHASSSASSCGSTPSHSMKKQSKDSDSGSRSCDLSNKDCVTAENQTKGSSKRKRHSDSDVSHEKKGASKRNCDANSRNNSNDISNDGCIKIDDSDEDFEPQLNQKINYQNCSPKND